MASSDDPRATRQAEPAHDELDEEQLSMRPSLREDEAAQLAEFDRYMQDTMNGSNASAPSDALPTPQPFSSFTASDSASAAGATPNANPATAPAQLPLEALYPSFDRDALSAVLSACNGDRAAAITMLNQSHPPRTPTPSRSATGFGAWRPGGATPAPDHVRSDAELAARLHRLETTQVRPRRANIPVRLDPTVQRQLVASLREIVVPALRAHFEELVLPDTRDESGSLVYELRSLQVAALTLPPDNVSVRSAVNASTVLVNVVNANLELEVGHWGYESRGFVPFKDSGRATVSVHGLNIALRLEARRMQGSSTRIVVTESIVTVDGVVRFKTHGTAADWAYNAMAVVFKPWVVSYIKEAVSDAVVRALAVHLRQWEFASELNTSNSSAPPATQPTQAPVTASE